MSGTDTGCPEALDACNYTYPSIYQRTTVGTSISAQIEQLVCDANDRAYCGVFDCNTTNSYILTLIGSRLGWPREHCNVRPVDFFGFQCDVPPPVGTGCVEPSVVGLCDGAYFFCRLDGRNNYSFTDDELYRSFIKAVAIKNRARRFKEQINVKLIREIVRALWGRDAYVFSAADGEISVTAGRDLTVEEIEILSLYREVICTGLGIRLSIYCTAPVRPVCFTQTNFRPIASTPPNPQIVVEGQPITDVDFSACFTDPDGDALTYSVDGVLPLGLTFDVATGILSGSPSVAGTYSVSILADDGINLPVDCLLSLTVTSSLTAPSIICGPPQTFVIGAPILPFGVFMNNGGLVETWSMSPAVSGLSIDPATGVISGTYTGGLVTFAQIEIIATNAAGQDTCLTDYNSLVGLVAPDLDCPDSADFQIGNALNYSPINNGGVSTTWSASGLPAGIAINPATGLISGVINIGLPPNAYPVTVTAVNASGSDSCTFLLNIVTP